jgi:acyl-CoA thioester hydrolase
MTNPAYNSNDANDGIDGAKFGAACGRLVADGHVLPLRVYYEDTDVSGFVYYANYLKFIERGRTDFLRLAGVDHSTLWRDHELALTVRRCEIEYFSPARLDDEIQIYTQLTDLRGASLIAEQFVRRDETELARCRVRIACIDRTSRAARLPPPVRDQLRRFIAT